MLPIMISTFFIVFYRMVKYSKRTNNMVHQILLDQTGTELTFVFKNQVTRRMRSDQTEATFLISSMVNPPQGPEYKPLTGDLIPETYPFDFGRIFDYRYFWLKYYISQRTFFAIPKRPIYTNYELLCNSLATNLIDFSQAEIYDINNESMTQKEFEEFLDLQNQYSEERFAMRAQQLKNLSSIEHEIERKDRIE